MPLANSCPQRDADSGDSQIKSHKKADIKRPAITFRKTDAMPPILVDRACAEQTEDIDGIFDPHCRGDAPMIRCARAVNYGRRSESQCDSRQAPALI